MLSSPQVSRAGSELEPKAFGQLAAAIPLQVEQDFSIRGQKSTPTVGDRASLLLFGVAAAHPLLADPVVETLVRQLSARRSQVDEELTRLQVVDEVVVAGQRMIGPLDVGRWILIAGLGECPGSVW